MAAPNGFTGRMQSQWLGLSSNLRGILWILIGSVFFSLNDMTVKLLGETIHPVEISFFRYVIGMVLLAPVFIRMGREGLRTQRLGMHFFRAVIAGTGQAMVYYAVIHLLLADATAFSFSRPIFMTVLAVIILGEVVGWRRWTATAVGFIGVLIMLRPGQAGIDPAALIAIAAAVLFAGGLVIIRYLSSTESPNQILFYYQMFGALIFLGPTVWLWVTPSVQEWAFLILIGTLTCAAMICFVRGFSAGEASILGPIEYMRLIYAALIGFFVFHESPDIWTWAGAAVIIGSAMYIGRVEAAHSRKKRRAKTDGKA